MTIVKTAIIAAIVAVSATAVVPASAKDVRDPRELFVATTRVVQPSQSIAHNPSLTPVGNYAPATAHATH